MWLTLASGMIMNVGVSGDNIAVPETERTISIQRAHALHAGGHVP